MNDIEKAKIRLEEISKKNIGKDYSLGDVLLKDKYEETLRYFGYDTESIEKLSPSYYLQNSMKEKAANDMYEALKNALACLEQEKYWCKKPETIIEKCKKAIDKAEGKEVQP